MKKTLIVANWKENKTAPQTKEWLEEFSNPKFQIPNNVGVVICPSFVLIPVLRSHFSHHTSHLSLGAQDVSKFEEGQYTGEVSAKMLKDFVEFVIIGHSERRRYLGETDEDVAAKSVLALKYDLIPIVCASSVKEARSWKLEAGKDAGGWRLDDVVFAYEPLFAVGSSEPDTPENAQKFAQKIRAEVGLDVRILYGGSVNAENVKSFVSQPDIGGVLVGQASLDVAEFSKIISNSVQI